MIDALAYALIGLALVAAGWGVLTFAVDKAPGRAQILFAGLVELATLVQSVVVAVRIVSGERPPALATTIGYLIGIVLLLPLAAAWALSDRSRFSGVVLAVAAFSVVAMTVRLLALWNGG